MRSIVTRSEGHAYPAALRLLAGRDYTVAALARKLEQRGYRQEQVAETLERLVAERFLDDRRYAQRFVEQARETGRYLGYRLRQELKRRGIPAELISDALDEPDAPDHERRLARQLIERRYAAFDPAASDERERRRVAGFLQRRGFSAEAVWSVVRVERGMSVDERAGEGDDEQC